MMEEEEEKESGVELRVLRGGRSDDEFIKRKMKRGSNGYLEERD